MLTNIFKKTLNEKEQLRVHPWGFLIKESVAKLTSGEFYIFYWIGDVGVVLITKFKYLCEVIYTFVRSELI